jgi:hypothetical protein
MKVGLNTILIVAILGVAAYYLLSSTGMTSDMMMGGAADPAGVAQAEFPVGYDPSKAEMSPLPPSMKRVQNGQLDDVIYRNNPNVLPNPQMSNNFTQNGNFKPIAAYNSGMDCFPRDQLTASDLLPREVGFQESNPAPQGNLSERNFFDAGYHGGIDTQSSSLKNGNQQLRSDPLIPRREVGPWMQSTIEPDTNRKPFEIGQI